MRPVEEVLGLSVSTAPGQRMMTTGSLLFRNDVPQESLPSSWNFALVASCVRPVMGGGSAGSVVASRLSEEPCVTVLLLEAGGKKPPMINDVPGLGRFFWNTDIDWQFKTVPQKHAAYFHSNKQVVWPSGKGLGGSSLLNAMLYVRGNHKDYDDWEAQGAKGWSYGDVLPYFLKLEDNKDPDYLEN
ncbi:Glucose dehydrogenase [FAD, quinone], partial [Araneus ventricosus]